MYINKQFWETEYIKSIIFNMDKLIKGLIAN